MWKIFIVLLCICVLSLNAIESKSSFLESKIIGGRLVFGKRYKYFAYLNLQWEGDQYLSICGVIIFTKLNALTTGQCVDPSYLAFMKPKTTYTLGVIVRRHRIIPGGSWHIITNIKTPKNYKFGKPYGPGDIAILTFDTPVDFEPEIMIDFPGQETNLKPYGLVAGWDSEKRSSPYNSDLKEAVIQIIENTVCRDDYKIVIEDDQFCGDVSYKYTTSFNKKDGGDPLIIQRENSKDEILGVLSHSCGKMLIFTNISVYDTLIKKAKEEYLAMSCD